MCTATQRKLCKTKLNPQSKINTMDPHYVIGDMLSDLSRTTLVFSRLFFSRDVKRAYFLELIIYIEKGVGLSRFYLWHLAGNWQPAKYSHFFCPALPGQPAAPSKSWWGEHGLTKGHPLHTPFVFASFVFVSEKEKQSLMFFHSRV